MNQANLNSKEIRLEETKKLSLSDYCFPESPGSFTGVLDFRRWSNRTKALHCYFTTDEGVKICLPVYWENIYCPKERGPCFRDVENQTRWYCKYEVTKNGRAKWLVARQLTDEVTSPEEGAEPAPQV